MLISGIILVFLALIFYSIGVWNEMHQGELKKFHLIMFWIGLLCDILSTLCMGLVSKTPFEINLHCVTGWIALLMMVFNTLYSTYIFFKGSKKQKQNIKLVSLIIWFVWLVPFVSGMFIGMKG
jgi:uncharacterized repeat protein (TIGR03987 family)